MLKSMTGFGRRETNIVPTGKICVELKSSNHKFFEVVLHLPEGFLSLEDRIKKEIEAKVKRGRVTCVINILGDKISNIYINEKLLNNYAAALKRIKAQLKIEKELSLDTIVNLPGVLSLVESVSPKEKIWPHLKILLKQAVEDLETMRENEGRALYNYLKNRPRIIKKNLEIIEKRFMKVTKGKLLKIKTAEEKNGFLKNSDITEEIERLAFYIRNFTSKFSKNDPVGKELDFIAQEMQREANTIGAKSCDSFISGRVVQIKSQIEKIREQIQNVE